MDINYFFSSFSEVTFSAPSVGVIACMALIVVLLVLSGFASGSEIAFFSLSPKDLAELDTEHSARDRNIEMLRDDSERTLSTILITNNFVNVTIIMVCNYVFSQIVDFGTAWWWQFIIVTVLLTFLLLLFGEVIPKVYSRISPLRFCRNVVNGILFCRQLFWPLETILLSTGALAGKVVQQQGYTLSVDELEQALELTAKDDIRDEKSMLEGIIRFGDEIAREVMTSRQDIVSLDINSPFPEVVKCIVDNNYSRIPVCKDSLDNITGILYIKDLLPHLDKSPSFRWQSMVRSAFFVPETKKIDDLLRDFQSNKVHIAIVVDEFGGTSGIITLEDILEEIVGEINDEYDEEEMQYVKLNYNTFVFEGKTPLTDVCRTLDLDDDIFDEIEESDTLAGLLLELKGDFPGIHEVMTYRNLTFEVLKKEQRRISRVKVIVGEDKD